MILFELIRKDVLEEARRPHELVALIALVATLSIPTSYLISGPGSVQPQDAPALVVIAQQASAVLVASLLGFLVVIREAERGTINALKLAPIEPETLITSKIVVIFVFLLILNLVFVLLTSFFSSMDFVTPNYLLYIVSLSLYLASVGALASFMIIYTDVGTLLASVSIGALSIPYLYSSAPQAVDALNGLPGLSFTFPPLAMSLVSVVLGKFLIEI